MENTVPFVLPAECVVVGSYLDFEDARDIDVLPTSETALAHLTLTLEHEGYRLANSKRWRATYTKENALAVDVIAPMALDAWFAKTLFRCMQVARDREGNLVASCVDAIRDRREKRLVLAGEVWSPVGALKTLIKYTGRGYSIDKEELEKLAIALRGSA